MNADTWRFLEALYAPCSSSACITLSALPPTGQPDQRCTPSRHILLHDTLTLSTALGYLDTANRQGWGAVVGIATRRCGLTRFRRGGKADLCELPALFVDVDSPDMSALQSFRVQPSCIVASGHGHHAYWFLVEPVRDMPVADLALRELARFLNGDLSMSSAQSMRLAGTVNTKPNRANALCRIKYWAPDRRYSLSDFKSIMAARHRGNSVARASQKMDRSAELAARIQDALIRDFDGYMKPNGWLAARCPGIHAHDRPGQHFGFNLDLGLGICFGRHGHLKLTDLCSLLNLR